MSLVNVPSSLQDKVAPILAAKQVHLSKCKTLYAPVYGTDSGSVYHVIAYNDHVSVAARIYIDRISFRVESSYPESDPFWERINDAGIAVKSMSDGTKYASIHIKVKPISAPLALKTVGSLLAAMQEVWTEQAYLPVLIGKGNKG